MAFEKVDFPAQEREILAYWEHIKAFDTLREINKGKPKWSFLDGPITANNPMGVHHAWGRTLYLWRSSRFLGRGSGYAGEYWFRMFPVHGCVSTLCPQWDQVLAVPCWTISRTITSRRLFASKDATPPRPHLRRILMMYQMVFLSLQ